MAKRIGLISDTHIPEARDSLWPQIADAFKGVDMIFHAGDIHDLWVLDELEKAAPVYACLLYTSPSPRDGLLSRMPSSA